MDILAIVAWVKANWVTIVSVYTALVTIASFIVKLTPTLNDDNALLAIVKFLGKYIALNRSTPDEAIRNDQL